MVTRQLKRVEKIINTTVDRITAEDWKKCIRFTREIEYEYRRKDIAFEHPTENFVIYLQDASDESDNDEGDFQCKYSS